MKNCKHCGNEVAKSAKVCPKCGGRLKKSKWLSLFIIIFVIIIIVASTSKEKERFSYEVTKSYMDNVGLAYYIEGNVINKSGMDLSYVQIEFICYDKNGNNLGTAVDNTNNLLENQTWKFKAMSLFSDAKNVDHCDYHEVTGW